MAAVTRRKQNDKKQSQPRSVARPLVVDLDGTLIKSDSLVESALQLVREKPQSMFLIPLQVMRGALALKEFLAARTELKVDELPYNQLVLSELRKRQAEGQTLILATGAHISIARAVANHLRLFDEIYGTTAQVNLVGENKRKLLVEKFGIQGFDYMGDSTSDLRVWQDSCDAYIANAPRQVVRTLEKMRNGRTHIVSKRGATIKTLARSLRIHQWIKNFLVLAPLALSHQLTQTEKVLDALFAFVSMSLTASAIYLINDMFDIGADRRHPDKKKRPLASGDLSFTRAVLMIPILLGCGIGIAATINLPFLGFLSAYIVVSSAYSFALKKVMVADVIILASLFTGRLFAGGLATETHLSHWLLAFTMFFFLSLAYIKRASELILLNTLNKEPSERRGYRASDIQQIIPCGIVAGYAAILVLSLYINSDSARQNYPAPDVLWAAPPILLYWISRVWMLTGRGDMDSDPIRFVTRDRFSWGILATLAAIWLLASHGS